MLLKAFVLALWFMVSGAPIEAAEPPLSLARDGFFYVGGKLTTVDGKQFMTGRMPSIVFRRGARIPIRS